jgi:hypothetical protein
MKTVARDVPPTGTFSIGTGKASTNVAATARAVIPASVAGEGSTAARAASARIVTKVPPKTTGATIGSSRVVSRDTRISRASSARDWAIVCVPANKRPFSRRPRARAGLVAPQNCSVLFD